MTDSFILGDMEPQKESYSLSLKRKTDWIVATPRVYYFSMPVAFFDSILNQDFPLHSLVLWSFSASTNVQWRPISDGELSFVHLPKEFIHVRRASGRE